MRIVAQAVSFIMHPLLMPTYAFLLLFYVIPNRIFLINEQGKLLLTTYNFLATFIIPVLAVLGLKFMKVIPDLYLKDKKDRTFPFVMTSVIYAFVAMSYFYMIQKVGQEVFVLVVIMSLSVFVVMIVSFYWKISAHAVGIGGLSGLIFYLALSRQLNDVLWPVLLILFISSIVCSARLILRAHKEDEVYVGFLGSAVLSAIMAALLF